MLAIKETTRLCRDTLLDKTYTHTQTHTHKSHLILYDAPGIYNDFN